MGRKQPCKGTLQVSEGSLPEGMLQCQWEDPSDQLLREMTAIMGTLQVSKGSPQDIKICLVYTWIMVSEGSPLLARTYVRLGGPFRLSQAGIMHSDGRNQQRVRYGE